VGVLEPLDQDQSADLDRLAARVAVRLLMFELEVMPDLLAHAKTPRCAGKYGFAALRMKQQFESARRLDRRNHAGLRDGLNE
jgi:hypothetical protein